MAYTRNTWHSGDKVTSAKLNNLESGSVAVFRFTETGEGTNQFVLDGSWNDVYNRLSQGIPVVLMLQRYAYYGVKDVSMFQVIQAYEYTDNEQTNYATAYAVATPGKMTWNTIYSGTDPDAPLSIGFE